MFFSSFHVFDTCFVHDFAAKLQAGVLKKSKIPSFVLSEVSAAGKKRKDPEPGEGASASAVQLHRVAAPDPVTVAAVKSVKPLSPVAPLTPVDRMPSAEPTEPMSPSSPVGATKSAKSSDIVFKGKAPRKALCTKAPKAKKAPKSPTSPKPKKAPSAAKVPQKSEKKTAKPSAPSTVPPPPGMYQTLHKKFIEELSRETPYQHAVAAAVLDARSKYSTGQRFCFDKSLKHYDFYKALYHTKPMVVPFSTKPRVQANLIPLSLLNVPLVRKTPLDKKILPFKISSEKQVVGVKLFFLLFLSLICSSLPGVYAWPVSRKLCGGREYAQDRDGHKEQVFPSARPKNASCHYV